jgi:hypothetical protein
MEVLMMENEVSNWNDDRLDELNRRVNEGFIRLDQRFVRLEGEMKEGFAKVDREMKEGFARVDKRFEQVDKRFEQVASREELGELKLASREEMGEVKAQLERLTGRMDRFYGLLIVVMVTLAGALIANGALT